jgi:hypothetical protein
MSPGCSQATLNLQAGQLTGIVHDALSQAHVLVLVSDQLPALDEGHIAVQHS